ncbi:major facilitator transporter, partial [mine drainage metagenome]
MNRTGESRVGAPGPGGSPSRLRVLAYTSLGHFINDGTTLFVPVVAALLTSQKQVDPLDLALLFLIYYTSSSLLSLWVGRRADLSGRPALLMAGGMFLLGAGLVGFYAALALFTGPWTLGLSLGSGFVTGFGTAFYHPLGGTLLQERFQGPERGKALGINGAMGSTGRALYPVLFFLIGLVVAADASLAVFALFAGVAGVVILLVSRERARSVAGAAPGGGPTTRSVLTRGVV